MQGNGPFGFIVVGLLALVLIVLGIFVFQIDKLEERFISQGKQLRALGEATDRLSGRIERLAAGGGVVASGQPRARNPHADIQVLRPDLPNLLEAEPPQTAPADAPRDGVFVRGWSTGDPKGFNPLTENAADLSNLVEHYVHEAVAHRMRWTDPDRYAPGLAWRVELDEDGRQLTLYLRRDVQWHTPSAVDLDDERYAWLRGPHPFTAHDLAFTFDMLMNPQVENGFIKSYYADLESWEALDDHTFRVRWKKKLYGNIESTLAFYPIPEFLFAYDESGERFPEETIGLRFNQHWYASKGYLGVGPYRMASYEPGKQIRLERNEDYFGDKPAIREIVYPIYTDPNRTLLMLKAGEVHFGILRPAEYHEEFLRWQDVDRAEWPADRPFLNGDIQCEELLRFAYAYVGWNADKPIFADARVRRAMTRALKRKEIIEQIYYGLGEIATGPFLSTSPYNDPGVDPLDFDLDAARALLAEAGWEDSDGDGLLDRDLVPGDADPTRVPFSFRLLIYASSPEWTSLANVWKEDLLRIGVKMDIEAAEWSLMQKRMSEKQFDAYSGGWALPWEGDPFQLWHSSQADEAKGSNRVGFRDPSVDASIERLRETFDRDERITLYRQIHRAIYDAQAYTFFRVPKQAVCWWKDLRGVRFARSRPAIDSLPWWVEGSR